MTGGTDFHKLGRLLNDLYIGMNVKFALMDENSSEIYTSSSKTDFCHAIATTPGGYDKCVACDREMLRDVHDSGVIKQYRCHAGLVEVAMPVTENGQTVAVILFGQMLDDSPREEQWKRVSRLCSWYPDMDELHRAFLRLRRISAIQIRAMTEIVNACVSEVRLSSMLALINKDDAQRLESFINSNFASDITVETACRELSIGKTKLYALCRERMGKAFGQLVIDKRMAVARDLLKYTEQSVAYIAETVGIPDPNYFTKAFKRAVGVTPSRYRDEQREALK